MPFFFLLGKSFFSMEKNLGKRGFCFAKAFFGNLPFFPKERRKEKGRKVKIGLNNTVFMKPNKKIVEKIALERIYRLFELAEQESEKNPVFSKKCIDFAKKISTRNRARIPAELKAKFCKKCGVFLKKGKNSEIEKQGNLLIVKCRECGFERKTKDLK